MFAMNKKVVAGCAATVAAVGLVVGAPTVASADPATDPGADVLVFTGSDTIQDVVGGFAADYPSYLASFEATGLPEDVVLRAGENAVLRPNGSTNGLRSLRAAAEPGSYTWDGQNIADQVDIARSSSGFNLTTPSDLAYVPFALDAVTYATASTALVPTDIPLGSGIGQDTDDDLIPDLTLRNIWGYDNGDLSTITLEDEFGDLYTVGVQGSGADIVPFVPQEGSGTRSFWQSTIGSFSLLTSQTFTYSATETECETENPIVVIGSTTYPSWASGICTVAAQEHNGKATAEVANAAVPFSIAQHIAQTNSSTTGVVDRRSGAVLRQVNGVAPTSSGVLNTSFPITRSVYLVAETARLTAATPGDLNTARLQKFLLDDENPGDAYDVSAVPFVGDLGATIQEFGFGTVGTVGTIAGYRNYGSF